MKITFYGQSAFALEHDGTTVLIDPFLTGNPSAPIAADDVEADAILLTHGHGDHVGDSVAIARRTGASITAMTELAHELAEDLDDGHPVHDPQIGGTVRFDWGWAKLVPALHNSISPKGLVTAAGGVVVQLGGVTVYHAGDTALFSDMALVKRSTPIDVVLLCIGGHYTMDRHDAVAAVELIGATLVIPCHFNTFPKIQTDASAFQADVERETDSKVVVLAPGESHEP